jgi:hypothetical protein
MVELTLQTDLLRLGIIVSKHSNQKPKGDKDTARCENGVDEGTFSTSKVLIFGERKVIPFTFQPKIPS